MMHPSRAIIRLTTIMIHKRRICRAACRNKHIVYIKGCDLVIVICGKYTDSANGVSAEVKIAQEENIPYFLLCGRSSENCVKPTAAKGEDKIYRWTWDNLKSLIGGSR